VSAILANVFLGCFLVGFVLTTVSLIFGMDSGHHFHFGGHDGFHGGGHDLGGHGHAGGHGGAHGHGHGHGGDSGSESQSLPFFSYYGIVMFVTWFGGIGYILNRNASATVLITLLGAIAAGFVGASIIFIFLGKFLLRGETRMNPADYYMPGTLGRITSAIREGGTGEITYVQAGARKSAGARSEDGVTHKQGEEVVIVRYDKGIAYVKSVASEFGES
jgi:membrane protein implicated in regulation of membrane protease activity